MRLVTELPDAISAIRRNAALCSVRLQSGRWCPRMAVGAVVVWDHSDPRCPYHLPAGAAKVCRNCSQLNASSDPWTCGSCRQEASA